MSREKVEQNEPGLLEMVYYVMELGRQLKAEGINLLQPTSYDQKMRALKVINRSDDRLKACLSSVTQAGMLENIRKGVLRDFGDETDGAQAMFLLDIYEEFSQRNPVMKALISLVYSI